MPWIGIYFKWYNDLKAIFDDIYLVFQLLVASTRLQYSYVCQPMTYINNKEELRVSILNKTPLTSSKLKKKSIKYFIHLNIERHRFDPSRRAKATWFKQFTKLIVRFRWRMVYGGTTSPNCSNSVTHCSSFYVKKKNNCHSYTSTTIQPCSHYGGSESNGYPVVLVSCSRTPTCNTNSPFRCELWPANSLEAFRLLHSMGH